MARERPRHTNRGLYFEKIDTRSLLASERCNLFGYPTQDLPASTTGSAPQLRARHRLVVATLVHSNDDADTPPLGDHLGLTFSPYVYPCHNHTDLTSDSVVVALNSSFAGIKCRHPLPITKGRGISQNLKPKT